MGKGNGYYNSITAEQAIKAAYDSKGNCTVIAKNLGCGASYVHKLKKKYPTFEKVVFEEREKQKDRAESQLFKLVEDGNITAIIFYLKTQAADRGYSERYQVELDSTQNAIDLLKKLDAI